MAVWTLSSLYKYAKRSRPTGVQHILLLFATFFVVVEGVVCCGVEEYYDEDLDKCRSCDKLCADNFSRDTCYSLCQVTYVKLHLLSERDAEIASLGEMNKQLVKSIEQLSAVVICIAVALPAIALALLLFLITKQRRCCKSDVISEEDEYKCMIPNANTSSETGSADSSRQSLNKDDNEQSSKRETQILMKAIPPSITGNDKSPQHLNYLKDEQKQKRQYQPEADALRNIPDCV